MELLTNKYKKMRKLYILLIVFAACLLAGCDENGESGYYEDIDRVYFVKDSLICRLGDIGKSCRRILSGRSGCDKNLYCGCRKGLG